MSIRARIMALVGCFALMALVVTGLGLATISDYNRMMKAYGHAYENAWRGERLNHLVSNVVMDSRGVYLSKTPEEVKTFTGELTGDLNDLEGLLAAWKADSTPQDLQTLRPVLTKAAVFVAVRRDVVRLADSGDVRAAETRGIGNRADRIAFQNDLQAMVNAMRADLEAAQAQADHYNHRRAGEFLIAALLGIGLVLGLSLWIVSHFITRPLQDVASAIIKTSKGEYDVPLEAHAESQDEVSHVWQALAVLKSRAMEAEQLAAAKAAADHAEELKLREILLD